MTGLFFFSETLAKRPKKCYTTVKSNKTLKQKPLAIRELSSQHYRWLNVVLPTLSDVKALRDSVPGLDQHDMEAILAHSKRPRIETRDGYVFLVLLFPLYFHERNEIEATEVDILISNDTIATFHTKQLKPIDELFQTCEGRAETRTEIFQDAPLHLAYEIINRLISYTYTLLDHIANDIEIHKKQLFSNQYQRLAVDIMVIRRNITEFRRIMQTHKMTLRKLQEIIKTNGFIKNDAHRPLLVSHFNDAIERIKDVWEQLEGYKESIEALHDTNESLISNRLNEIMRSFTTISVLIFTMTLVATVFGLGAHGTPFVTHPLGFWFIIALLVLSALLMLQYFKRKQWLK